MKYALWLSRIPGIGGAKIRMLMEQAAGAREVYGWSKNTLEKIPGLKEKDINAILESRKSWNLDGALMDLREKGIHFVSQEQAEYPAKLRNIANAPYGLYYKGNLPASEEKMVAIVGARERSEYGRVMAQKLAEALGRCHIPVISGLARGIDADSHIGALSANGQTYAVLGCGVDICYPRSNQFLYERILAEGGGILSEYAPQQEPAARLFPSRNRIISGLSDCVVVVEAREKSGSLITADFAMEQGKDVYAVPGRVTDSLSMGCNRLLRQGAGIITSVEDFLEDLHFSGANSCIQMDFRKNLLEKDEGVVYSLLDFCPTGIGTLVEKSGMPLDKLLETLSRLEAKEFARESVPNYYVRQI